MQQIAAEVKSIAEVLGTRDYSSEDVRRSAKKIASIAIENFTGDLLEKAIAVSVAMANLAYIFDHGHEG